MVADSSTSILTVDAALIDLLRCPECGRSLAETAGSLDCEQALVPRRPRHSASVRHRAPVRGAGPDVRGLRLLLDALSAGQPVHRGAVARTGSFRSRPRTWPGSGSRRRLRSRRVHRVQPAGGADMPSGSICRRRSTRPPRLGPAGLVQADLNRLPFRPGSFDVAYSIGVLHHLEDPGRGWSDRRHRPSGRARLCLGLRAREQWLDHLRRRSTAEACLPPPASWLLKWAISAACARADAVREAGRTGRADAVPRLSPLAGKARRHVRPRRRLRPSGRSTSHYIRREEFERWFRDAGLVDVQISWRNRNSWRGLGRVPTT